MERWFTNLDDLGTKFAVAGLVLFGIGSYLGWGWLANLGLVPFGAGVVAWGADAIQRRELRVLQRGISISERLDELIARVWGVLILVGGMLLLGYGILALMNPRSPFPPVVRAFFDTTPGHGVLLLGSSVIGLTFGLTLLASEAKTENALLCFLFSLPGKIFGVLVLIISGAVAAIGLLQIFAPDAVENLLQSFLQALGI